MNNQTIIRFIVVYLILLSSSVSKVFALEMAPTSTNTTCSEAIPLDGDNLNFNWNLSSNGRVCDPTPIYYTVNFMNSSGQVNVHVSSNSQVYFFGPFTDNHGACDAVDNFATQFEFQYVTGGNSGAFDYTNGLYYIMIIPENCSGGGYINGENMPLMPSPPSICETCIKPFQPTPGKYIISAWVRTDQTDPSITFYEACAIKIRFSNSPIEYEISPTGRIIDGWQLIESMVVVPFMAYEMTIELISDLHTAFFDDIRFFPFDGSMVSYVYDPINLRLMAELDERNYATFYEYDEEGNLYRVKKETEKGVMTIQENRANIHKKTP